jgi:peptide/nickel transport system ATP-binding protein
MTTEQMVEVEDLTVSFRVRAGIIRAIRNSQFSVAGGEVVAVVGESGSGKTTLARALLGDLARNAFVESGRIVVCGSSVLELDARSLSRFRRVEVGYVPQNPGAALNPVRRIGLQIDECRSAPSSPSREQLLHRVGLSGALVRRYPHELSGGQQQRVAIAMAIANAPKVLLLDEPTTGLDVVAQAGILELVRRLARDQLLSVVYITHDLAAASAAANRILVMYAGETMETGVLRDVYRAPLNPYTSALLAAIPTVSGRRHLVGIEGRMLSATERSETCVFNNRCPFVSPACRVSRPALESIDGRQVRCIRARELELPGISDSSSASRSMDTGVARSSSTVLEVNRVRVVYGRGSSTTTAVAGANVAVHDGETLAIVGESGSGKTSLSRAIVGLVDYSGEVLLRGHLLPPSVHRRSRDQRRRIQYVFQNPTLALNPRHSVHRILSAPLASFFSISNTERDSRIAELLDHVGLPLRVLGVRPNSLSGGEQQRVAIARALAAEPEVLICDEVVSALDVSVQAAIIDLLASLQQRTGVAMLFISHDFAVVRSVADRVAVMHQGEIVEMSAADDVFSNPRHVYTRQLLASVPDAAAAVGR